MKPNFKFGNQKKKDDDQEVEFKISETMVLKNLPPSISSQFIEVYKLIKENREFIDKKKNLDFESKEKELCDDMEEIKNRCIKDLYLPITSLGNQIDNGRKMLKESQLELDEYTNDKKNENMAKNYPSPFLTRYSKQLEDDAECISEKIEAYKSHLQSLSDNCNDLLSNQNNQKNDVLLNFLYEENEAILRFSSKISQLSDKLSFTRKILCQKLKIDQSHLVTETKNTSDSVFQLVKSKYKQFLDNKKSIVQRNLEDSDLFGIPTKIPQSNIAKPLLGSGGFGSFVSNRKEKDNNFTPPPMINTQNATTSSTSQIPTYKPPATPASNKAHSNPFK